MCAAPVQTSREPSSKACVSGRGVWFGVAMLVFAASFVFFVGIHSGRSPIASDQTQLLANSPAKASFENAGQSASSDVRHVVNWIVQTNDNAGTEFVVIDKKNAIAHVFNGNARWMASSPVLVGSAQGDESAPGIGTKPLILVKAEERTTPAGRFVGELGVNAQGDTVVWVDYDAAVSLHSVRTTNVSEKRLQRLASPNVVDNRISYGCINFPDAFFKSQIVPRFTNHNALVYVLPDRLPLDKVFRPRTLASVQ
jgi:hypothetical protein